MEVRALPRIAGSVARGYAARMLDQRFYDEIARTRQFRRLRALTPGKKYSLEAIWHLVGAVLDLTMGDHTVARRFLKDLATDAPSELAARLINGRQHSSYGVMALPELTPDELRAFLDWFEEAPPQWRASILEFIKRRTATEIARILRVPPRERNRLVMLTMARPLIPKRVGWVDRLIAQIQRPLLSFG